MIHHIEECQLNEEIVKNSQKLSIVDFHAEWCEPCQIMTPILKELDKKYSEIEVYKIDIDEAKNLTMSLDIKSIPTLVFFKYGEEVERKVGLMPLDALSDIVEELK